VSEEELAQRVSVNATFDISVVQISAKQVPQSLYNVFVLTAGESRSWQGVWGARRPRRSASVAKTAVAMLGDELDCFHGIRKRQSGFMLQIFASDIEQRS
jgi:hypothetical protein